MSMRYSIQHRVDNILKAEETHMISIINSNFKVKIYITQLSSIILNQPYSQIEHSKPKQIAYDNETNYHGYEIYPPTQISLQT